MSGAGLVGTQWDLISIVVEGDTVDSVEDAGADLTLGADGRAAGRGGCNRYFGQYTLDGEDIRFGPLASTLMYCEKTMEVERSFFKALELVRTVRLDGQGVEMRSEDERTTLVFRKGPDVQRPMATAGMLRS